MQTATYDFRYRNTLQNDNASRQDQKLKVGKRLADFERYLQKKQNLRNQVRRNSYSKGRSTSYKENEKPHNENS
jgi:hypothetical protein